MENLPSDVLNYNLLLNLSVDEIYSFCLAGKANYAYCDSTNFWRNYFHKMSHSRIQKIVKSAAKKKLFGFIKFVCENTSAINLFLDLRTINYCYYYFAEQNNEAAVHYLYNYMINNYIDENNPDGRSIENMLLKYRIDENIIIRYDNLDLLKAMVNKLTANNVDITMNLLSKLWQLLNNSYYTDYIIDYIMKDYNINHSIVLLRICLNIIHNMTNSNQYYDIFVQLIAYMIRKNEDRVINLVKNEFSEPEIKIYFIENINYGRYIDIFGEIPFVVRNMRPQMFRDKRILDLYMKGNDLEYLTYAYKLISPEHVFNYITLSKKVYRDKIDLMKDLVYHSKTDGYTYWSNIMADILEEYISKNGDENK